VSLVTQLVARDACRCARARDKTRSTSPSSSSRVPRYGRMIRALAASARELSQPRTCSPLAATERRSARIDRPRRKSMPVQLFKSLPGKKRKEGRGAGRGPPINGRAVYVHARRTSRLLSLPSPSPPYNFLRLGNRTHKRPRNCLLQ